MRIQVTLDEKTEDNIDSLAKRMKVSRSKMVSLLVEAAIEDNEWLIKVITHPWVMGIRDVLGSKGKKRRKEAPEAVGGA